MPENTQQILGLLLELWNTGKAEVANKLYSSDAERSDPTQPEPARGAQQIAAFVAEVRAGFPDFKLEIKQGIAEGDRLATEWTVTGTHRSEWQGIPPTGRRVEITGMTLDRIKNGQVIEERVYFDRLALLEQLGVAPSAAQRDAKKAGN